MKRRKNTQLRDEQGKTQEEFLAAYDITKYDRPSVTVDSVVMGEDASGRPTVLLIKRRNHPFIGMWAFPGGFLNMEESPERGAERELNEETGVTGVTPRQIGAYGRPDRDPRGRIITIAYLCAMPNGAIPIAGDDAKDAGVFTILIDESEHIITLCCEEKDVKLTVPYKIAEGRAEFIPGGELAGDHTQILADALIASGRLKTV